MHRNILLRAVLAMLLVGNWLPAHSAAATATATTHFVNGAIFSAPVAYWTFDDSSSTTARDFAGSRNATLHNGASLGVGPTPPITGQNLRVLNLDGTNDYADILTPTVSVNLSTSFSVAGWIRRASTGNYDAIYDSGTETNKWWVFIADNDKLGFGKRDLTENYSTQVITDTAFHHVAVVKSGNSGTNLRFYIDGVLSGQALVGTVAAPTGTARIGVVSVVTTPTLQAFFNGTIDDLRIYGRALSAGEVLRLAQGKLCETTGLSWPAAQPYLQCALEDSTAGDQVWIAGGSYRASVDRGRSFAMRNHVNLFGGFNGTESTIGQRPSFDPKAPLTVLSGDLARDDVPGSYLNTAENTCNVVLAPAGFSAALDGMAIRGGNATCGGIFQNGGGLLARLGSQVALNNVVFKANQGALSGGGLFSDGAQVTITAMQFVSNTAASGGGGLAFNGGAVTITASSFVSNTANMGGAVNISPGQGHTSLAVSNSTFTANSAGNGGAVHNEMNDGALDIDLSQVTFTNNQANFGGAIQSVSDAQGEPRINLSHVTFTGNQASQGGGAIATSGGELSSDNSQFNSNTATGGQGGAIKAESAVTVTNSTFTTNIAQAGGALFILDGALVMSGTSVIQNKAQDFHQANDFTPLGGGVLVSGTAVITGSRFLSNTADIFSILSNNLAGGGGLAASGSLAVTGSEFRANRAEHGGGLQVVGTANIQQSLFQGNNAGSGGGVFADGSLVLVTSRLIDNTAFETLTGQPSVGGGLFVRNGGFGRILNNLFLGNQAFNADFSTPHGSALSVDGFTISINDNTIVARGLEAASAASVTGTIGLFNNIITSHTVGIEQIGGVVFEDYNLFHGDTITATGPISPGGHSRAADPLFAAASTDDFHLRLNSPAIDAGDNNRVLSPITSDLDGGPRFVDVLSVPDTGAGTAPMVDMGAYEVNNILFLPLVRR